MNERNGGLSFERDLRPLFRPSDRAAMLEHFDLWNRDDVAAHSQAILQQPTGGSMPCDAAWPTEQVAIFRQWIETGTAA